MEKTFPMTKEGLDKLKAELENLKLVKRPEVIDRIKVARSYGDLSENSEYEAAKDEQAFIEGRISTVETMIRYAEIVDNAKIAKDEVALGKNVTFVEVGETDEESLSFHLYGDRRWTHLAQLAYLSKRVRPENIQVISWKVF